MRKRKGKEEKRGGNEGKNVPKRKIRRKMEGKRGKRRNKRRNKKLFFVPFARETRMFGDFKSR